MAVRAANGAENWWMSVDKVSRNWKDVDLHLEKSFKRLLPPLIIFNFTEIEERTLLVLKIRNLRIKVCSSWICYYIHHNILFQKVLFHTLFEDGCIFAAIFVQSMASLCLSFVEFQVFFLDYYTLPCWSWFSVSNLLDTQSLDSYYL